MHRSNFYGGYCFCCMNRAMMRTSRPWQTSVDTQDEIWLLQLAHRCRAVSSTNHVSSLHSGNICVCQIYATFIDRLTLNCWTKASLTFVLPAMIRYHNIEIENIIDVSIVTGWLRSTVGRTSVFGRRTDPVLRSACIWRVTTMWVNRPLQVSQLGQLSLSSFRGR